MKKFLLGIVCGALAVSIPAGFAVHLAFFRDVGSNRWYSEAVNDLTLKGFFSGYPDGSFRPGNYVNRAELAVVLQQMLNYIEESGETEPVGVTVPYAPASSQTSVTALPPQPYANPYIPPSQQPSSLSLQPTPSSSANTTSATVNTAYNTPYANSLAFVKRTLVASNNAIRSTLGAQQSSSSTIGVNDEVLSESYGLYLNALARAGERDTFNQSFQFFKQYILSPEKFAYWKLNSNLTPYQRANATIDDLRIIKGLLRGYQKFAVAEYRDTALAMANALKTYGMRNNVLVSHITWNENGRSAADHLILGYADFEAMDMLRAYDPAWNTILQSTMSVVINGQLANGLFADRYNFAAASYSSESSHHMIFEAYIGEHLALAGERISSQRFLNFLKNEFSQRGKIFARYNRDGTPAVSYEDLAVYAINARMALALQDTTFADSIINKILSLQINSSNSTLGGAFLWSTNELVYAFSQLNALDTVALFRNSTIQPAATSGHSGGGSGSSSSGSGSGNPPSSVTVPPPTQGSVPVIGSNNYVVWHMADIFYGTHHVPDLTTMVNDMDNLTWHDAIIAGDISGDGSMNNLTSMKGVIVGQSSHPWSDFNFLAGNHEYNCGGTAASGCLDNYKSVINPALRYTFDRGNIHFIVMSTDGERHRMSDATMAWLRSEVAANQDKIIVLATHHMPHVLGGTPSSQSILDSLGVDVWLFGHAHCKHGDSGCTRHEAYGDYYQQAETTFVDAGYIGNMESRYIIFTEGSNQVRILSRSHKNGGSFQQNLEHTAALRYAFRR